MNDTPNKQPDWPPQSSAVDMADGQYRFGSTGQLWRTATGQWARVDCWIECECPVTNVDFDRFEIVGPDTVAHCSECGGEHRIGDIGQLHERDGDDVTTLSEEAWRAIASASQS